MSPLMDYTTKVPVSRTAAQIQGRLVQYGAHEVLYEYDGEGNINALSFVITTAHGNVPIRMPLKVDATLKVLERQADDRQVSQHYAKLDHARRVAWRILKDWLEAQLALLETEMVTMEEIFLPYVLIGKNETVYEAIRSRGFKQITGGEL